MPSSNFIFTNLYNKNFHGNGLGLPFLAAKFLGGVGECKAQLISGTTPVYFTVRRPDIPGQGQDPN